MKNSVKNIAIAIAMIIVPTIASAQYAPAPAKLFQEVNPPLSIQVESVGITGFYYDEQYESVMAINADGTFEVETGDTYYQGNWADNGHGSFTFYRSDNTEWEVSYHGGNSLTFAGILYTRDGM